MTCHFEGPLNGVGFWRGLPTGNSLLTDKKSQGSRGGASQVILRNAKKHNIAEKIKSVNKVLAQMLTAKKLNNVYDLLCIYTHVYTKKKSSVWSPLGI